MSTFATTTPTANAVPIADGAGVINAGWIGGVIGAIVGDVLTFGGTITAPRTITVPDASFTLVGKELANVFSAKQTIDLGTGALPTDLGTTPVLTVATTDGNSPTINSYAYAAQGLQLYGRRAAGTRSVPTATTGSADVLLIGAAGHDGSAWESPQSRLRFTTDGAHTGSNYGFVVAIDSTPNGSTTRAEWARWFRGSYIVGATSLIGTEIARFKTGGDATALTPLSDDVLLGGGSINTGGKIKVSDTSTTSIQSAGGATLATDTFVSGSINSTVRLVCSNASAGVAASATVEARNDLGTASRIILLQGSSGNTNTAFGITLANWGLLETIGASVAGMIVGVNGVNVPIVFGINASEVARFTSGTLSTGSLTVAYTTASTSTITGSAIFGGGIGVAGAVYAGSVLSSITTDAGTATQIDGLVISHRSSGTPAAGFGTVVRMQAESTTTDDRNQAVIQAEWVVATDASRTARISIYAYDTAAREVLRGQASGSAPMIGFLGAAAVARATMAAATGTATRTTYDTTTVTLPQLAERVKALIDDFRAYGLHG